MRAVTKGVPAGKLRQRTGAGIIEVEVTGEAPDLRVSMIQSPATFGPIVPEERRGPVLDALGISSVESASVLPDAGHGQRRIRAC